MERKFTEKQVAFIAAYEGNGTEAARIAGYKGNDNVLGVAANELLRNPKIVEAIKSRQDKKLRPLIASREDRQRFWTRILKSKKQPIIARLKASELLGRSEADFTDVQQHKGKLEVEAKISMSDEQFAETLKKFDERY